MIDLTGGFLVQLILSELRPVLSRHPRFRENDGEVSAAFSNMLMFKDVSVTVNNVRSNGDRQSPDSFLCTILGRVCAAKLENKPGAFVEWVRETDPEGINPPAGIYYLGIDAVDEKTREVKGILETYHWLEGYQERGNGSRVHYARRIPPNMVRPTDLNVQFRKEGWTLVILTYTASLSLIREDDGTPLIPGVDWWVEPFESHVLVESTPGGQQNNIPVPPDFVDIRLVDQDGFPLREGMDWRWDGESTIQLAAWTPPRAKVIAEGSWRRDPTTSSYVHPENFLDVTRGPEDELVPDQCFYSLVRGTYGFTSTHQLPGNRIVLHNLLDSGDRMRWEFEVKSPQSYKTFYKMASNGNFLPGLTLAVGDRVEVGDQIALVVFPRTCEVYEAYGAKDGVSFEVNVKSNDLLTSTELANMAHVYLQIESRDRLESLGLSIKGIGKSYQGDRKDNSGTTSTHTCTLTVEALGDWEIHKPLVNRVDDIDVSGIQLLETFPGKPHVLPKIAAFGVSRFTPSYQ